MSLASVCQFNPFKKYPRRGDARHAPGRAFPALLSSGGGGFTYFGRSPERGKGLRGL